MSNSLEPMLEHFRGAAGLRRLAVAFGEQQLVLNNADLALKFARAAAVISLEKGNVLYIQGEAGKNFAYFLISGQLDLLVNGFSFRKREPGDMLGEFPIIEPGLAHAVTIR